MGIFLDRIKITEKIFQKINKSKMSLAKISPAFDQFLENFILYELTKDSLETTNYETKNYNAEYENAGQSEDSIASSSLSSGISSGSTGSNSGGNGARPSVIVWNHAR